MEIVTLYSGQKVIQGGGEVFADSKNILKKVLETGELPKALKPGKLPKSATQKPKPRMMAKMPATSAKPRLEMPRQKKVAEKPKEVEIKPDGDWFNELESLDTANKNKEKEAI